MLENIKNPADVKKLNMEEKKSLAEEIRRELLTAVSKTGGHLASNLGSVEMTIALHSVFNAPADRIFFDVGHQAYAHKMLTGRYERIKTIRKRGGLSGFPRINESIYDASCAGHASDSISLALGSARAIRLNGGKDHAVAVVGDGALTGGMCYEALNDAGHHKTPLIVILNDNAMSISGNVGGLSKHLTKMRQSGFYRSFEQRLRMFLSRLPHVGEKLTRFLTRIRDAVKSLFVSDLFFDSLGIEYLGPIDGHDIAEMERVFERAKQFDEPVVIHVITKKGRGYRMAEDRPDKFHGVAPFFVESGKAVKEKKPGAGDIAVSELIEMAKENDKIAAVSAAMLSGTGLSAFQKAYPDRCFDVGIAEEHAVSMAAGLALGGMKPYVAIYSTFLQRAYDQVMMDVCLNDVPVTLLIDRAGLNGEDGETHQGIFDIGFLRSMPNMVIASPADGAEIRRMLRLSEKWDRPMAIRYPKALSDSENCAEFEIGQWEITSDGSDIALIASGRMVDIAVKAKALLENDGISACVINARFIRPMDEDVLNGCFAKNTPVIVIEDGCIEGGFGEEIMRYAKEHGFASDIILIGCENGFIEHAEVSEQTRLMGMDEESIYGKALKALGKGMPCAGSR